MLDVISSQKQESSSKSLFDMFFDPEKNSCADTEEKSYNERMKEGWSLMMADQKSTLY